MVDRGDNTYGGKYAINPSGGLILKDILLVPLSVQSSAGSYKG